LLARVLESVVIQLYAGECTPIVDRALEKGHGNAVNDIVTKT